MNALQAGDSIKAVQEQLGHYSTAFTMDVYAAVSDTMRHAFIESQMNKEHTVLWEHTHHGGDEAPMMQGWTENYIRLQRPYDVALAGVVTPMLVSNSTIVENFACDD